jgi:leucine dehydrogenase
MVDAYGVEVVEVDQVYDVPMDIYSPCALGATVNDDTLDRLKCSIIAGAANNQLADEVKHGQEVMSRGMIYVPDYLINAGGIINCYWEVIGYNRDAAMRSTEEIYNTASRIFAMSKEENLPTYLCANRLAEARIEAMGNVKLSF